MMQILVEVAAGELVDKLTILEIKLEQISDPAKLENIRLEYQALQSVKEVVLRPDAILDRLEIELKHVNELIWKIEDDIRDCERAGDFGPRFVELARSVYRTNDRRAATKREINKLLSSKIVEEKSYSDY